MDEQQLIAGSLEGSMEDFRMIVERYRAPAMALALNVLRNRDDAGDCVQPGSFRIPQEPPVRTPGKAEGQGADRALPLGERRLYFPRDKRGAPLLGQHGPRVPFPGAGEDQKTFGAR